MIDISICRFVAWSCWKLKYVIWLNGGTVLSNSAMFNLLSHTFYHNYTLHGIYMIKTSNRIYCAVSVSFKFDLLWRITTLFSVKHWPQRIVNDELDYILRLKVALYAMTTRQETTVSQQTRATQHAIYVAWSRFDGRVHVTYAVDERERRFTATVHSVSARHWSHSLKAMVSSTVWTCQIMFQCCCERVVYRLNVIYLQKLQNRSRSSSALLLSGVSVSVG